MAITGPIKGPISNIPPELREINLDKQEEEKSTQQPAGQISTADSIEAKTANTLADALEAAQQNAESSGQKELSAEEQKLASNFHPEDFDFKNLSPFLEDARSRSDSKNSNTPPKDATTALSDRLQGLTEEQKSKLLHGSADQQTPDAVKDAGRLVDGGSLRDALNDEVAERNAELKVFGGTAMDRLLNSMDPTSRAPENTGSTYGKGMISQGRYVEGEGVRVTDADKKMQQEHPGLNEFVKKTYIDGGVDSNRSWGLNLGEDAKLNEWTGKDGTNWRQGSDGTQVGKGTDGTVTVIKGDTKTVTHQDGSWEEYKDGKKTDGGGPMKSYDYENYTANIPPQIQSLVDYFKQQAMALKPQTGSGNVDPGPEGDDGAGNVDSKTVVNQAIRTSGVGTGDNMTGPTGPQSDTGTGGGTLGSPSETIEPAGQHGGAVDFGPDSDKTGWTGPTRTEDPGDIKFGPQDPVEGTPDSKQADDTGDSSSTYKYWQSLYEQIAGRFKITAE